MALRICSLGLAFIARLGMVDIVQCRHSSFELKDPGRLQRTLIQFQKGQELD